MFEIDGDRAILRKLPNFDAEYHQSISSTLSEWLTPEDDEAFRDL